MSEPHEHNPSGFEQPPGGTGGDRGTGGANRFWEQYSAARGGRAEGRNGEPGDAAGSDRTAGALEHECLDWCPICRGAEVVRATTPPELRDQLQTVQRDALVLMKALIDAYLVRLGAQGTQSGHRVEEIRID
jgi:hypothetical protein